MKSDGLCDLTVCCVFRHNSDCCDEITTLAVSAVSSLMSNIDSLPHDFLTTLLMTLIDTTKVCVLRTNSHFMIMAEILGVIIDLALVCITKLCLFSNSNIGYGPKTKSIAFVFELKNYTVGAITEAYAS